MTAQTRLPDFAVVSGQAVRDTLAGKESIVMTLVRQAYLLHGEQLVVNPPSSFLRFPAEPANRIIALPSAIEGEHGIAGLKWIASFPANVTRSVPRASAVLVLNDLATGYPLACLEASVISAARTAASASVAAVALGAGRPTPRRVAFIGTGLIARYIHSFLTLGAGFAFDEIHLHDLNSEYANSFADYLHRVDETARVVVQSSAELAITEADLVVFATTASTPHIGSTSLFDHHPLVLHVSLRDLAPEVVLAATNVVDDVDHCLRAQTSLHRTEELTGDREHVHATLYDVLVGAYQPPTAQTVVFSPFGLGVLDLVIGRYVYEQATAAGSSVVVPGFFAELDRWA